MLYRFSPVSPSHCPASGRGGPPMVSGEVYEIGEEWAAMILATVLGFNGAPSLVPVAPASPVPPRELASDSTAVLTSAAVAPSRRRRK